MALTPYDWNQSIQTRMEYIEERLRAGSPVVGLSLPEGIFILSVHHAQRKIFEVYDRLAFSGVGNQSDVEAMRNAAIDFAHREGFQRSPDDVTAQRLVGSVLSPALKKAFADPFTAPFVFRGLFAEVAALPEQDAYFTLGCDGEYRLEHRYTAVAGTPEAENAMLRRLHDELTPDAERETALATALEVWGTGRHLAGRSPGDEDEGADPEAIRTLLREELREGVLEVALLERSPARESRFRLLRAAELEPLISRFA